jgi:hypothetical protein
MSDDIVLKYTSDKLFLTAEFNDYRVTVYTEDGFINITNICDFLGVNLILYVKSEDFKKTSDLVQEKFKIYTTIRAIGKEETSNINQQGMYAHPFHVDSILLISNNTSAIAEGFVILLTKLNCKLINEKIKADKKYNELEKDAEELCIKHIGTIAKKSNEIQILQSTMQKILNNKKVQKIKKKVRGMKISSPKEKTRNLKKIMRKIQKGMTNKK